MEVVKGAGFFIGDWDEVAAVKVGVEDFGGEFVPDRGVAEGVVDGAADCDGGCLYGESVCASFVDPLNQEKRIFGDDMARRAATP